MMHDLRDAHALTSNVEGGIDPTVGPLAEMAVPVGGDSDVTAGRRRRSTVTLAVWLAAAWLAIILLAAIFADLLPLADPNANVTPTSVPPFRTWPEILGSDQLGRSMMSRLAFGARVSFAVGLISGLTGMLIGVTLGLVAGINRLADQVVGVLADSILAFPAIVALLALGAAMTPGTAPLVIGLSIFAIPSFVRLARASTIQVKEREFVKAARLLGASTSRVLTREILPSVIRPVLAYFVVVLATLIVAEASVSFLGLGVPPPTPTWGGMIADGESQLRRHPELVFVPASVLFLTILSIGVLGRWLRAKSTSSGQRA